MTIPFQNFFLGSIIKGLLMVFDFGNQGKTLTPAQMKEVLSVNEIFPEQLKVVPHYPITIEYARGPVNFGTNFTETEILEEPTKIYWPVEKKLKKAKKMFTMILYGPDVPTRENPIDKYHWIHWIIINIPGNRWREGKVVTEYRAWQPFYTNDIHRCIFLVYPQKTRAPLVYNDTLVKANSPDEARGYFNKDDFAKKYNLDEPYAINFFQMYLNSSEEGNIWRSAG